MLIMRNNMVRWILMILLGLVFTVSSFLFVKSSLQRKRSIEDYNAMRKEYYKRKATLKNEEVLNSLENLDDLAGSRLSTGKASLTASMDNEINKPEKPLIIEDMVGWIRIDGTEIDYPVVKGRDNSYYLKHNPLKRRDSSGAIFMDFRVNTLKKPRNIVIYGHNMRNGTMFHDLNKFNSADFFKSNRIICLNIGGMDTEWEVFSVYDTNTQFDYTVVDFVSRKEFEDYIKAILERSIYKTASEVSLEDQILTLSTCTNRIKNGRLVVHSKRVK